MSDLRERKRRKTLTAIHEAAMALFAERGYGNVTVAEIADAADVGRATVFSYYGSKEEIVLGESAVAVEGLRAALAGVPDQSGVLAAVREWLRTLVGWVEPDLLLQMRLADEVPAVAAARSRLQRAIEEEIAVALAHTMPAGSPLLPRLVAGALGAALSTVELEAARRLRDAADPLTADEVDRLFDAAVSFVDGGVARLADGAR
ncbi:TetR/AcrR family transcriptional regulator [Patulibacter defluvii]|uniref:TetR/AcrR family transcriptional regulator n=1 Tax=Patulibacter defluvii TaxID=3095358 RepID=UPI002A748FF9|nr:helix-turn-helix domain-containing protein [Patulibacter sp. DM4]